MFADFITFLLKMLAYFLTLKDDCMKNIITYCKSFTITLIVLWLLLILTSCIPNTAIKENMLKSAIGYSNKDPFEFNSKGNYNSITDNYADSILLNVIWNIKSSSPFISSIDTKYYDGEDYGENWGLYHALNGTAPNTDYTRYWHGSSVFIRPFLIFTDVNGVKNICFTLLLIFIGLTFAALIYTKHYFAAIATILSLIGIHFWNIRLSLEYIPAFIVCFALCPIYILFEKKGNIFLTNLSVIGGVLIAFFDFLTVETISILIPLTLVFIIRADDNRLEDFKNNLIFFLKCATCWGISYAMTFFTKWVIASICTGENKITTAISAAGIRVYNETEMPLFKQIYSAVAANISTLFGGTERIEINIIIMGLIVTAIFFVGVFFLFRKKELNSSLSLTLITLSFIPYIRYIVLSNHSYLHEFFTYRAQITVILCLYAIVWHNIKFSNRKNK